MNEIFHQGEEILYSLSDWRVKVATLVNMTVNQIEESVSLLIR